MKRLLVLSAVLAVAGCTSSEAARKAAAAPLPWCDPCTQPCTPPCGPVAVAAPAPAPTPQPPPAAPQPPAPPPPASAPPPVTTSDAPDIQPPPKRVEVTEQKLELKEKVYFDAGKATIKPVSFPLLDDVAQVLKEHGEVKKVRIEGHTDNKGSAQLNTSLSKRRAEAVRAYLVKKGVEKSRLDAEGYGPSRPVADNGTAEGREKNRRVEFMISGR